MNGDELSRRAFCAGLGATSALFAVVPAFAATGRANLTARGMTSTTAMAAQKMEQLRSLTWGFDAEGLGLPLTDTTTNVAVYPPTPTGTGLNPSPVDALERNTPGFVDFVDENGGWVGTGNLPPGTARYIRRWSIEPLPTNPNNTIVIQVLVSPVSDEMRRGESIFSRTRMPGDALLITVKTRKAS